MWHTGGPFCIKHHSLLQKGVPQHLSHGRPLVGMPLQSPAQQTHRALRSAFPFGVVLCGVEHPALALFAHGEPVAQLELRGERREAVVEEVVRGEEGHAAQEFIEDHAEAPDVAFVRLRLGSAATRTTGR